MIFWLIIHICYRDTDKADEHLSFLLSVTNIFKHVRVFYIFKHGFLNQSEECEDNTENTQHIRKADPLLCNERFSLTDMQTGV